MLLISFNKDMTPEDRQRTLNSLKKWMDDQQVSHIKRHVLQQVITYAEQNLIYLSFFLDKDRIRLCKDIFSQADLPDILFVQYVLRSLDGIRNSNSDLRNLTRPIASQYKNALLTHSVEQFQNIGIGAALLAVLTREKSLLIISAILILGSGLIAEARLDRQLDHALNEQLLHGIAPRIGDGWDDLLIEGSALSGRALRGTARGAIEFFKRKYPDAVEEQKRPALAQQVDAHLTVAHPEGIPAENPPPYAPSYAAKRL